MIRLRRVLVLAGALMGLCVAPSLAQADSASDYRTAVLADDPVSYWRLNDSTGPTAVDQQNLNPGQITGATLGEPGPFAGSGSMRFGGSGDVNLGTDPSLRPPNNWTVEAWFKASAGDTANCINTYHGSGCALYAVHAFGLHLVLDPQGHVFGDFDSTSAQGYSVESPGTYGNDIWHHIVLVRETAQLRLYIDGSQVAATAVAEPTTFYCCENIATIANDDACRCAPLTGWESEVAFYNYPLSATRIEAHWAAANITRSSGGSPGGGTTPIPVPPTGGSCVISIQKCPPPRQQGVACKGCSRFDGAYNQYPYITVGGIYARVRNYSPWVDPASYSVSAWVGLQDCKPPGPNECNENELAQTGWREQPHGQRDALVEYLLPGDFSDCNPQAVSAPGANNLTCNSIPIPAASAVYSYYTILYGYEPGKFTFYVDGHKVASAPARFVPHQAEVYGETNLVGDQMPGDAGDPQMFDDIHVFVNGAWQPFTATPLSTTKYEVVP